MPLYQFQNNVTGELWEEDMKIAEMEEFLQSSPDVSIIIGTPGISSGRGMQKPDLSFRHLLQEIKKNNSRGSLKSTINTF